MIAAPIDPRRAKLIAEGKLRPTGVPTLGPPLEGRPTLALSQPAPRPEDVPSHSSAAKAQPRTEDGRQLAAKPVGNDGNEQRPRGTDSSYLAARIARDAPEVPESPPAEVPRAPEPEPAPFVRAEHLDDIGLLSGKIIRISHGLASNGSHSLILDIMRPLDGDRAPYRIRLPALCLSRLIAAAAEVQTRAEAAAQSRRDAHRPGAPGVPRGKVTP